MRSALEAILHQAQEGDLDGVIQTTQRTLEALDGGQLLTTREAARLLGIRSINTLKALVIRNGIPYQKVGNRMMLPLAEVERLRQSPLMRGLRASEALHETTEELGPTDGLTAEEIQALEAARPGHLPWKPQTARAVKRSAANPQAQSERAVPHAKTRQRP